MRLMVTVVTVVTAVLVVATAATNEVSADGGKYPLFSGVPVNLDMSRPFKLLYLESPQHSEVTVMDDLSSGLNSFRRVCGQVVGRLGSGGFSTVYEVKPMLYNRKENTCVNSVVASNYYALKVSNYCSNMQAFEDQVPDNRWQQMDRERLEPKLFDGRFFVNTFGYGIHRRPRKGLVELCMAILMEKGNNKLLPGLMSMESLSHQDLATVLFGVASAMLSMEVHGKFNCDVKNDNVLLFQHEGRYISKMSDLTNSFLLETTSGEHEKYERELSKCVETCDKEKEEVCASYGTYMIRSPWWIMRALDQGDEVTHALIKDEVTHACANPHTENRWSLLTMIIQILQAKDSHDRRLGDKFPRDFGVFDKRHFLSDYAMPFSKVTVQGKSQKMREIGKYYYELASDIENMDTRKKRRVPLFKEGKASNSNGWGMLKDLMRKLVIGASSGEHIDTVLRHPYLSLRFVRMDDYDEYYYETRSEFLRDREKLEIQ